MGYSNFKADKMLFEKCKRCGSENLLRYKQMIVVYDIHGYVVGYDDCFVMPYQKVECEDCGWEFKY